MRIIVAFSTGALFAWGFVTLVLTRPDVFPYLATLLALVFGIEYWLASRRLSRRASVAHSPGIASATGGEEA